MKQRGKFALSRECSSRKNAPVFFLFSSLLHFSSGSTMYGVYIRLRARAKRANFLKKRALFSSCLATQKSSNRKKTGRNRTPGSLAQKKTCGLASWFRTFRAVPKTKNACVWCYAEVSKKWKVNGNKALKNFFGSPERSSEKFALCLILYFVCMRRFFYWLCVTFKGHLVRVFKKKNHLFFLPFFFLHFFLLFLSFFFFFSLFLLFFFKMCGLASSFRSLLGDEKIEILRDFRSFVMDEKI